MFYSTASAACLKCLRREKKGACKQHGIISCYNSDDETSQRHYIEIAPRNAISEGTEASLTRQNACSAKRFLEQNISTIQR